MPADLLSLRSVLFMPGSDERKIARAVASDADAIVADLEDAVSPNQKHSARETLRRVYAATSDRLARFVRVNGAGTPHFEGDVALLSELRLDGVVLPKATPEGVAALEVAELPILAIIETAAGVRCAYEIASRPSVFALLLGAVDLGTELGLEARADGLEINYVRSKLVIDSAAAGIRGPFDGVHVEIRDDDGLAGQAELARSLGLRGKACIHPAQVPVVNRVFAPRPAELGWARRIIEAAEVGAQDGRGAVELEGVLVDAPVVARARRIIAENEGANGRDV